MAVQAEIFIKKRIIFLIYKIFFCVCLFVLSRLEKLFRSSLTILLIVSNIYICLLISVVFLMVYEELYKKYEMSLITFFKFILTKKGNKFLFKA